MGWMDEYNKALKKYTNEPETQKTTTTKSTSSATSGSKTSQGSWMDEYNKALAKYQADDKVPVGKSITSRMTTRRKDKKEDEEKKRKWFEKGLFEDGYDFGDISKTILGSVTDVGENLGAGIMGMGEKALDALAYLAPAANVANQAQNSLAYNFDIKEYRKQQKDSQEFIKKDLYDEEAVAKAIISDPVRFLTGVDAEKDSVFGEKSDSLIQSGGQLLGTIGLQAAGVPWFVTSGVTSFGSEAENAFNQGASYEQAGLSAAVSAGAEMLTEKLFGGSGLGEKGLVNLDLVTRGISNKLVKALADYGVDMAAEGAEEVASQFASNFGSALYREENMKDILLSEEAFDEYLESFIGGAALGGLANASKFVGSAKKGTDYRSDFTQNEQKVVDKVYQDRLAELEKKGKVTAKQKSELHEAISRELEKGYISIEDIEAALGGDTYEQYKQVSEWEDSLQQEYDTLHKMKRGDMTGEQIDRENHLRKQIENVKATSGRNQLKTQLSEQVFGLAQGDRLVESYNEKARRGQAFEADLTQYDAKQQAVIQKAVESGVLNNTNRTHELVDMIAKISADKGVLFDFTNNAKLKESGFAIEGKQVNGYVTKDGVMLNVDSPKYLESTVGHEITHVLEGTEFYTELQNTLFEYAKSKGEYDSRLANLTKLYEGVKDADVNAELTADLVGDYLFRDADFIKNLSVSNRNVFQKIYDEIKYLCKVVTAGSKEARELEKVKKAFEDAYRASGKAQTETKYSLTPVDAVQPTNGKWSRTHTTEEAMARFPNMWNVAAEESEVRNPTQIVSTVNSYRKIYNFLQNEGFNGTILDASSGLGYGTKAGIEEYGFDVEDIEPYPDKGYNPKYQDYSTLDKKYDVIISNAVLNVLPQDQRDALAVKMGEMLNEGGRLFVNVRGKDVESLAKTGKNIHLGNMEWIETVKGSYQKGFTKPELVAYLQDALGDGFTVKPTNMFGAVSAVVTKDGGVKYSLSSEGLSETDKQDALKVVKNLKTRAIGSRYADGYATYTPERMDREIQRSSSSTVLDYAKSYITWVDPTDFIYATTVSEQGREQLREEAGSLDVEKLRSETQPIHLTVDFETGEIVGHEGRHRMLALEEKGIRHVAIIIDAWNDNRHHTKPVSMMKLKGQKFSQYHQGTDFYLHDLLPLSKRYADAAKSLFTNKPNSGGVQYSLSESEIDKTYADAVKNRDWETAQKLFDDAANKAGYTKVVYHGTDARFTEFDTDEESTAREQHAWMADYPDGTIFLAEDYDVADGYGERVMNLLLDTSDIKVFEEPDMYAHRAMDDKYGYEVYNYPVIAVKGKDMTIYATLDNTAVKSADTATYDDNGKLIPLSERFNHRNADIRFSLSESVEETKELMAIHNLHASEVLKQLEMGGMPYPSVAITNPAKIAHEDFGDISIILNKDAIDPKKSKYNRIYSSDAYTPTFPHVSYEASKEAADRVIYRVNEQFSKIPDYYQRSVRSLRDYTNLNDYLNRWGGEQGLFNSFVDDHGMKQIYLAEKGEAVPVEVERTETQISDYMKALYQKVIDRIGVDAIKSLNDRGYHDTLGQARIEWTKKHLDLLKDIYAEDWSSDGTMTKDEALEIADEQKLFYWYKEAVGALEYLENGGLTVVEKEDFNATNAKIDEKIAGSDYKQWLSKLFSGIEGQSGIRNNKETFTPRGTRRSFSQLHDPVTIDNVIKAMRKKEQTGQGAFGTSNFNGAAVEEYGSIAEAKRNANMLGVIDETEYKNIKNRIDDQLLDIARRYANGKDIIDAKTAIVEAVAKNESKAGIARYLKQYDYVFKFTDDIADDIIELRNYVRSLPRPYFEAKPRRAVGFDEVGVFVIPYDADVKLKQELLNRGYAIAEYDPKVEGDRQRVVNQFEEYKFSLSNVGDEAPMKSSYGATLGKDVRLETAEESTDIAPVSKMETTTPELETIEFPDDGDVVHGELERLTQQRSDLEDRLYALSDAEDFGEEFAQLSEEWADVSARIKDLENSISESESGRIDSLTDADMPPETDAPYYGESDPGTVSNPFENRDWYEVGTNRSARAFMVENPEFQPFFQSEAMAMLGELGDSQKAERWYNDQLHYESGGEKGFGGQKRFTSQDIARLLDEWHLSYAQIEEGLTAIVENNSKVNNAPAKRIEFMLNDRLLNGYKDFHTGQMVPPNQEYQNMIREWQVNQQARTTFDSFMPMADQYAPAEEVAPVKPLAKATPDTVDAPVFESKEPGAVKGQTTLFEPEKPKVNPKVARVLTEESAKTNKKSGIASKVVGQLVDKGMVFENLSLKTGNHELQAKYNYALPSNTEARAQYLMENGDVDTKSLKQIIKEVKKTGKTEKFFDYLYHVHNIDRMSLEDRFDVPNKAVFGETVTADVSRQKVFQYEKANPEFKGMAEDVYAYNKHLRKMLVKGNVISQETADLWEKMYPHYVPVRRVDQEGLNISVPLDSRKTGVNNPVKRATGGSSDIEPLFETMAMRTEQTYRAIARNDFGIELMNTLGSEAVRQKPSVDEMIDTIGAQEDLLKPGTVNSNPTFAVFENGEKVEFEITEDMFDALKPAGKLLGYRNKAIHKVGNWRRNLLTSWNPIFAWYRNPIKDLQDVAINSQHPVKTYLNIPNAIIQMAADGKYATEYHKNGGKANTYFDSRTNQFKAEDNIFKKTIGMPVRAIETVGEIIEEIPRLAEYIASRQSGRSVERSMLDAARVTTNFAAGGDFTKFLNSHGFTFLNASVQGASQHIRNIREAKQQGLKGYVKVLAKYTVAGLPGVLLNSLLWDDDEDYEELNDYVKQNYYVIAKTEDGKFVRIPKGRTAAVVQECMEQMQNLVTGDDEADFGTFFELFMNNIAPNNPIENNILAPIGQVMSNKAWYGDDLVPSRLQKLPAEEQFDESTDSISKWLGEKTGTSPYKWNYLIDQYSGGLGDVFLPMKTPEAESGDNSLLGNILAPWKKEITTDKVLNNKNPGDFYDLKDELEVMSNSKNATDEDKMRSLYMDTVGWEMSDLYAQKREIQNSDLPDDEKYEAVREVQDQINALANNALDGYNDVHINGLYSEVGGKRFNHDAESGKWYEIKPKNADGSDNYYYQQEQKVTKGLGISYGEYWNNREEYNFAYDKPGQYAVAKSVGGYDAYMEYYDVLQNWQSDNYIAADKDSKGNSISGSRKEKVIDYINGLDADYGTKIILFRTVYSSKADKRAYNQDIVDYLNSRDDISYQEMKTILEELDFKVDSEGNVTW